MVRPPYGAAVRLCGIAEEFWPRIAAAYYQINVLRQPPHQFANLVYAWAVERISSDKIEEWHTELNDLLPWQDATSPAAEALESESFLAMQAKG